MATDPPPCFLGVDAVIASPAMRQVMQLVERIARTTADPSAVTLALPWSMTCLPAPLTHR